MTVWALLLAFATWRVTSLLYIEEPFAWLRKRIGIVEDEATGARSYPCNVLGEVFECFWCLSLVVSFLLAAVTWRVVGLGIYEALIVWLASAAGALVLDVRYFARLRG